MKKILILPLVSVLGLTLISCDQNTNPKYSIGKEVSSVSFMIDDQKITLDDSMDAYDVFKVMASDVIRYQSGYLPLYLGNDGSYYKKEFSYSRKNYEKRDGEFILFGDEKHQGTLYDYSWIMTNSSMYCEYDFSVTKSNETVKYDFDYALLKGSSNEIMGYGDVGDSIVQSYFKAPSKELNSLVYEEEIYSIYQYANSLENASILSENVRYLYLYEPDKKETRVYKYELTDKYVIMHYIYNNKTDKYIEEYTMYFDYHELPIYGYAHSFDYYEYKKTSIYEINTIKYEVEDYYICEAIQGDDELLAEKIDLLRGKVN